jgi:hypothetical protein
MRSATNSARQGDVFFRRVPAVPKAATKVKRNGAIVVAHSETGHNHVIEDPFVKQFDVPGNPLVCYLQLGDGVDGVGGTDVIHQRSFDTHETVRLLGKPGDVWEVRRQREWTPEGWQRVAD